LWVESGEANGKNWKVSSHAPDLDLLDDMFAELVKAKKQAKIAALTVRKAGDPEQYERDITVADSCGSASMPTKTELQGRKRTRRR
jgi:hypothetical protein